MDFQGFCDNNNILRIESTKEEVGDYIISNQAHKSLNTYITVRLVHCLLGETIKYLLRCIRNHNMSIYKIRFINKKQCRAYDIVSIFRKKSVALIVLIIRQYLQNTDVLQGCFIFSSTFHE